MALVNVVGGIIASLDVNLLSGGCLVGLEAHLEAIIQACPAVNPRQSAAPSVISITSTQLQHTTTTTAQDAAEETCSDEPPSWQPYPHDTAYPDSWTESGDSDSEPTMTVSPYATSPSAYATSSYVATSPTSSTTAAGQQNTPTTMTPVVHRPEHHPRPCPDCPDRRPQQPPYCARPFLSIDIMALGLDVDLEVYLNLAGLLGGAADAVGGLLGGILGDRRHQQLPEHVPHQYRVRCGTSLARRQGGRRHMTTAVDDCLARCERDAIRLTAQVGELRDCLGVSLDRGVEVDNCLYFVGLEHEILDVDVSVVTEDPQWDSFCR